MNAQQRRVARRAGRISHRTWKFPDFKPEAFRIATRDFVAAFDRAVLERKVTFVHTEYGVDMRWPK